jgi:hypothetical protein
MRSLILSTVLFWSGFYSLYASPIPASDASIIAWATGYQDLIRGPNDISTPGNGNAAFGDPNDILGPSGANGSDQPVISLGDGGSVVLTFAAPITNGSGDDFAVFENANGEFLELAFVEVSSDGSNFFRFAAISNTQTDTQVGTFGQLNPNDLSNLAGKYSFGIGTGFDLQELAGISGIDINAVTHVKIIDVVGSIDSEYATYDSLGNIVNDPWKTDFSSSDDPNFTSTGGFDLDAVGVINAIPEPSSVVLIFFGIAFLVRHVLRKR